MDPQAETTTKKRNDQKNSLRYRIPSSFRQQTESHVLESSTSRDISTLKTTFSSEEELFEDEVSEGYVNEYTVYLLRKLQRKIVANEAKEREDQVKRSLVALKKEYEELLEEKIRSYEECKNMQMYGKAIESLDRNLAKGREVLEVLGEVSFIRIINMINEDLEKLANSVALVDLEKKDVEYAFEKGLLGFNSSVYKLLKEIENYVNEHNDLVAEIVQELKDIESINSENEMLRKKCCELVEGIRSNTITTNYDKFYKMALEACKDVRDATSMYVSENGQGPYVRKSGEISFQPSSSSTPS